MGTFLAALLLFALAFAGLALGALLGREPIRGSCGGLRRRGLAGDCNCASPCPRQTMNRAVLLGPHKKTRGAMDSETDTHVTDSLSPSPR